jgi:YVTN family beta-propeller protein
MGREGWLVTALVVLLVAAFVIARMVLPEVRLFEGRWHFGHNRGGIYREIGADNLSSVAARSLARVYVPNVRSNDVYVIDPATLEVVDRFAVGNNPQHVVPSWDLKTLWVTGSSEDHRNGGGSLTPIDPFTGKPGRIISVPDAYNLYFTPDGRAAIVVAEQFKRLEFRDPHTMRLIATLPVPQCDGVNHADYSGDEHYAVFTCEFGGALVKIDMTVPRVVGFLKLGPTSMPQDVRAGPDGKVFFVADMMQDGVAVVDGRRFAVIGFIHTGIGTHGLCVSRDGRELYVSNRGSHSVHGPPHGQGSVSVIDFATRRVLQTWSVPGGGSPDMGNVSADGKTLWLSGRFDNVVYRIDTQTGAMRAIAVGHEPHGLTVWPQPGRYSLGHTGNMR